MIDAREPLRALHARAETAARAILTRVFKYQAKTEKQLKVQEAYKEDMRHINAFLNTAQIYINTPLEMVYVVAPPPPAPEKNETPDIKRLFDDACKRRGDEWLREANRERRRAESIARAKKVWEHLY